MTWNGQLWDKLVKPRKRRNVSWSCWRWGAWQCYLLSLLFSMALGGCVERFGFQQLPLSKGTWNPAQVLLVNWQRPLGSYMWVVKSVPVTLFYFCLSWPESSCCSQPKVPSCNIVFPADWMELGCREKQMWAREVKEFWSPWEPLFQPIQNSVYLLKFLLKYYTLSQNGHTHVISIQMKDGTYKPREAPHIPLGHCPPSRVTKIDFSHYRLLWPVFIPCVNGITQNHPTCILRSGFFFSVGCLWVSPMLL